MKLSYDSIGQWCATFACSNLSVGDLVKISASDTVAKCSAGDVFAGTVASVGHGGDACAVTLGGLVTVPYTGTAPAVGWCTLAADGANGVKTASPGRTCLAVRVNTADQTVTFAL
jgi:hypothetical protein